jgi:hypothetical protein
VEKGGGQMLKKMAAVLIGILVVFSLSAAVFAQAGDKKESRVEGRVERSNKDSSTLTVRVHDTETEKTVHYDASTKFASQYHGEKKVKPIDASEIKDGDQVICLGSYDDKGVLQATMISKRLSHSPQ